MTDEETREYIRDQLSSISWLVVFTFAVLIVGLSIGWIPEGGESLGKMIQRAGSLVVLFSVITEYKLLKLSTTMDPGETTIVAGHDQLVAPFLSWYQNLSRVTLFLIVVGTLIWGYGDLIFDALF